MTYGGLFDIDRKIEREEEINKLMTDSSFWDDVNKANEVAGELKNIKSMVSSVKELSIHIKNNYDIVNADLDDDELLQIAEEELGDLKKKTDELSLATYLNGEYDEANAIIEIHSGAGGTESCDWVSMLYRMYTRYALNNGYQLVELDKLDGDEAGNVSNKWFICLWLFEERKRCT